MLRFGVARVVIYFVVGLASPMEGGKRMGCKSEGHTMKDAVHKSTPVSIMSTSPYGNTPCAAESAVSAILDG